MAAAPLAASKAAFFILFIAGNCFSLAGGEIIRTREQHIQACFGISTKGQWIYAAACFITEVRWNVNKEAMWCMSPTLLNQYGKVDRKKMTRTFYPSNAGITNVNLPAHEEIFHEQNHQQMCQRPCTIGVYQILQHDCCCFFQFNNNVLKEQFYFHLLTLDTKTVHFIPWMEG